MTQKNQFILASLLGIALLAASCASSSKTGPDPRVVLRATADKLKVAKTLHVSGTRVSDPALLPAGLGQETARFEVTVLRPGKLAYKVSDGSGTRRILADAKHLTLTDDRANTYATLPHKGGTIDSLAREIEKVFDYQPIGLELLGSDPMKTLLDGVTSSKFVNDETVGGVLCHHLSFTQRGLTWDLWIAMSDLLPRQLVMVFTDLAGQPRRSVTMNQWTLNSVVPESDFVFTPRRGAQKVDIIPAR